MAFFSFINHSSKLQREVLQWPVEVTHWLPPPSQFAFLQLEAAPRLLTGAVPDTTKFLYQARGNDLKSRKNVKCSKRLCHL